MLHARRSSLKEILVTSKNLALDSKKHDFNMVEMQKNSKEDVSHSLDRYCVV